MKNKNYAKEITVEEAIALIKEKIVPMAKEIVSLDQIDGRVLGDNLIAKEAVPPFDRSPYDGYAFRAEDIRDATKENPVTLRVIEEVPAGKDALHQVGEGEAIKILTGAPIPKGANVVEKFEKTSFTAESVTLFEALKKGSNICLAGEDIPEGKVVLEEGCILTGTRLGMLAALGFDKVDCYKKITCAIICTGSELLPVDAQLTPGKIRSSSGYMFQSWLKHWGMDCDLYGIVIDDETKIKEAISTCAKTYDVIITTGGVSVGDYDFMERALDHMEADMLFSGVVMKPGMAFMSAMYQGKLVLALSGNPSAAAASLCMVGRPVLSYMAGQKTDVYKKATMRLLNGFPKGSPARRFLPGIISYDKTGNAYIDTGAVSGNGVLSIWSGCNGVAEIQGGSGPVGEDALISVYCIENTLL